MEERGATYRWVGVALLTLVGCGTDLPAGWEQASLVEGLVQSDCQGNPYEPFDERVEGDITNSPLMVQYREAHFRCVQDVEAYARVRGDSVDVLVQPVDMEPSVVAACDCLYDITFDVSVEVDLAPRELVLYRRWDHLNVDNDPAEIGRLTRE